MTATINQPLPLLDSSNDAGTSGASNQTNLQKIQNAAKSIMQYASLAFMFILPGILESRPNGFIILFSILTAISFFALLTSAVQKYYFLSIKMWPKILDVGVFVINICLIIYTQASGKTPADLTSFLEAWSGFILNLALLCVVLISLLVRMPFTMQIAKENVPEEHWSSPTFITINYHITLAWAVVFALDVVLKLLGIYVYP
jgi:hypothetical protein